MYLVLIGWLYVAFMMAAAEATSASGTLLGAVITFLLYGLGPVALVGYVLDSPRRRRAIAVREMAETPTEPAEPARDEPGRNSGEPDAGREPAGGAEPFRVTPVRKEP